ncbi:adenosylcobinamide amidohydrolase [Rhodobacteraceae bacterium R_SAG6]|nr:adenosylcobinamide amidohydrolase [Rhodobacteraceae bacterium R_SAG6]
MTGVILDRPWLRFDLGQPHQVLSWAVNRPGMVMAQHILWREVRNSDLPKDLDVTEWFATDLQAHSAQDTVAFLTSRDVRRYTQVQSEVGGITAHAVATVGLSNAERIGHRMDYSRRNWGTINIAVQVSCGLTPTALIEAMSIATQARTAAVMDAKFALPIGVATGTGTDCIAVAAPEGQEAYAGLHTALGEVIGHSVYTATLKGAREWINERQEAQHA